jgi:uncharacterized OsmC-like protein
MEVTAQYAGHTSFEVAARGHRVVCDQPSDNGGDDAGMTPPEFLLASLATCAGYYAAQYLNARKLSTEGLSVTVSAGKALQPARLDDFRIEVHAAALDDRHEAGLLRAVKSCLIHNTLAAHPAIDIVLRSEAAVI